MPTPRRPAVEVKCWKEYTCAHCGTVFRHLLRRKLPAAMAAGPAEQVRKVLARNLGHRGDLVPCPGCGLVQPGMVAARHTRLHLLWTAITLPVPAIALLVLGGFDFVSENVIPWLAAGVAGLALVGHFLIDRTNPNRNPDANRGRALALAEAGTLRQLAPGGHDPSAAGPAAGRGAAGRALAYLSFLLAVVALAAPELVRAVRGWPLSPGWHPPVVGPGDDAYVYFAERLPSVKGLWTSQGAAAELVGAGALGLRDGRLRADSKRDRWGGSISVKPAEKRGNARVWVRVHFPPAPALEGKEAQVRMRLDVVYPVIREPDQFVPQTRSLTYTAAVRFAAAGAGGRYRAWWCAGLIGGGLAVLVLSLALVGLARAPAGPAPPAALYPFEGAGEPPGA